MTVTTLTEASGLQHPLALEPMGRVPRRRLDPAVSTPAGSARAGGGARDRESTNRPLGPASRRATTPSAGRRRPDIRGGMTRLTVGEHLEIAEATPAPRPILDRLAGAGLNLIAEIKRSVPSAGEIVAPAEDIVARARAYDAGGRTTTSVRAGPPWVAVVLLDCRLIPPVAVDSKKISCS